VAGRQVDQPVGSTGKRWGSNTGFVPMNLLLGTLVQRGESRRYLAVRAE
jgi:hypothetical protein